MIGRPMPVPPELRDPEGGGCEVCGIALHPADNIMGAFCSPECAEHEDRCGLCRRGPTWCDCEGR